MNDSTQIANFKLQLTPVAHEYINNYLKAHDLFIKDFFEQQLLPYFKNWYDALPDPMAWEPVPLYKSGNLKHVFTISFPVSLRDELNALSDKHGIPFNGLMFNIALIWLDGRDDLEEDVYVTGNTSLSQGISTVPVSCDDAFHNRVKWYVEASGKTQLEFMTDASLWWNMKRIMRAAQGWRYKQPLMGDRVTHKLSISLPNAQHAAFKAWAEADSVKLNVVYYNMLTDYLTHIEDTQMYEAYEP